MMDFLVCLLTEALCCEMTEVNIAVRNKWSFEWKGRENNVALVD